MSSRRARAIVIVISTLTIALLPLVVQDRFLLKIFTFVGLNALVVVGISLLFGYAGQVSLGHAGFVGLGAYTAAFLVARLDLPWLLAMVAAGLVTALGGMVLAVPSLRLKGHYLAMATLGFGELMTLGFKEADFVTGGVNGFSGVPFPSVGALVLDTPQQLYWLVWSVVGVALLLAGNIVASRPGRAMRALHGSELGAQASGVDVVGVKVRAFVLSATFAGLSGALYASIVGFISPSLFTTAASVTFLAMAVIGGSNSLAGPLLSVVLLTLLEYLDALVPGISRTTAEVIQAYQADIYGLAIIAVILFAPSGLAGMWRRTRSTV
ncbi:MAG: branched-chain amino acid ABC transporter permease [Actinobacteria bacterium HGW-Actinobacteria-7]|nr:MAG: branched-chain amino acid ABC transporter permease [Actinobacteria bacterium HGW-Actinobacteria-7]